MSTILSTPWYDLLGTLGVAMILFCYLLIQIGRIDSEKLTFSVVNGIGASLILVSLYYEFNFASVLIEGFWVVISLIGVGRYFYRRRSK
ncbi:MAG: hypothetical protein GKR96_08735 [Gammaproteobacteria bacterium]|nr:hypothetical protein [Gammaproteobacteria bacterium]